MNSDISKRELYQNPRDSKKESNQWSSYLENNNHVLFGSKTPIFMAKRNKFVEDPKNSSYIQYYRVPFVSRLLIIKL